MGTIALRACLDKTSVSLTTCMVAGAASPGRLSRRKTAAQSEAAATAFAIAGVPHGSTIFNLQLKHSMALEGWSK
jgi:hypothetical protein